MNHQTVYKIFFLIVITPSILFSQGYESLNSEENDFDKVRTILHNEYVGNANIDTAKGIKQFKRWEWFWEQRFFGNGKNPNSLEISKTIEQYKTEDESKKNQIQKVKWQRQGPFETPGGKLNHQGIGRINDIAIDKTNGGRIIVGTAGGGAWLSTNAGQSWNVIETTDQLTTTISDVAISESNPNIVYIGTGDANGTLGSGSDYYSVGLLKSIDGGKTVQQTPLSYQLDEQKIITKILIDPSNEDIVYVSTTFAIYKTVDGGENWNQIYEGNIIKDMEFKPDDSNVIYAVTMLRYEGNQILKSIDGGENWSEINFLANTLRVEMDVTESEPDNIYIVSCNLYGAFSSFQFSSNAGNSWSIQSTLNQNNNILGGGEGEDSRGQGAYDLAIAVYPKAPNVVFVGGINIWISFDNGKNFEKYTHWFDNNDYPTIHADQHQFAFSNSGDYLYVANDGGLYRSYLDSQLWEELNNGMDITQFYRLGVSQRTSFDIMAGAQDNGTSRLENQKWTATIGGDGMECAFHPTDPKILYNTYQYGELQMSTNGGKTFSSSNSPSFTKSTSSWVAPFIINQSSPNEVLIGYNDVWINVNNGDRNFWNRISDFTFPKNQPLRTLAMSESDENYIYTGNYSTLMKTSNGGKDWNKIAESENAITYIAISPTNPEEIYITKSGYSDVDKVSFFDGDKWYDITGNLPSVPINTIIIENYDIKSIYVGTDIGVFYSEYNSGNWKKLNGELPNTVISELEIHKATNTLFAATYGRGIWTTDLLNCNSDKLDIEIQGSLEICSGDSVTLKSSNEFSNYLWNTGDTTRSIVVKKSGKYMLTVENSEYCSDKSDIIDVEVIPTEITSENGLAFCLNDKKKTLKIPDDIFDIKWSNGESDNEIIITEPGIYYYSGIGPKGCKASDTISIVKSLLDTNFKIKSYHNKLFAPEGFSYKWYYDGFEIPNSNTSEITISDLGNYYVNISDEFGCSLIVSADITTDISNEYDNNSINIFPNPSDEFINIEVGKLNDKVILFQLYSTLGEEVLNTLIGDNMTAKLDIKNLPSGIYFAKINLRNNTYFKKIIIR